jgi:hypothetical protein
LTSNQKAMRLEATKMMIQQLAIYMETRFQHRVTGNESWITSDYMPSRIWTMARNDIDPIAQSTSYPRKIMMIFFSVNGITLIYGLPEKPSSTPISSVRILSRSST